jgi:hypothetical protein
MARRESALEDEFFLWQASKNKSSKMPKKVKRVAGKPA